MNPEAILETYVADVVRRLPRGKRADVAFELRSLLAEELEGRAAEAGRPADAVMATDLLRSFGAPVDVADRYRPAGFTIIRPSDAPTFARVALIGVGVQWVITLIAVYTAPMEPGAPGSDWLSRLGSWWLSWGLGAFWWPGFIVTITMIAAFVAAKRQRPADTHEPSVSVIDRDRVKRPALAVYIGLGVLGAAIMIALPTLDRIAPWVPAPVLAAFEFDAGFLAQRAGWVLLLWGVALGLAITVLAAGRWSPLTRRLAVASDVLWLALLAWWVFGGRIFATPMADEVTKGCLVLLIGFVLVDLVIGIRRLTRRIPVPAT
jgi:hypothetical protein